YSFPSSIKGIYSSIATTYVVLEDGSFYMTGYNSGGIGGLGTGVGDQTRFTKVSTLPSTVKSIISNSNSYHALALLSDNRLFGFGSNSNGQLGNGTDSIPDLPTEAIVSPTKSISFHKTDN